MQIRNDQLYVNMAPGPNNNWYCLVIEKTQNDGRVYKSKFPLSIMKPIRESLDKLIPFAEAQIDE